MTRLPTKITGLRQALSGPGSAMRWLMDLQHDRKFENWPGAYRGVYRTFEEARSAAPSTTLGFDHPELANLYDDRLDKAFPSDYPALFWLNKLLPQHSSVFDWGGHIGVSFYAYGKYLTFPSGFRWRVCEVPEIAKAGQALAVSKAALQLSFTTDPQEMYDFEILLAAGSLQYLEAPLSRTLAALSRRPQHLLINKLPVYDGDPFVTLQNTMHSYNPYKVDNRAAFVSSIVTEGYELVDAWETPDMACRIPLFPGQSLSAYSGFYFRQVRP